MVRAITTAWQLPDIRRRLLSTLLIVVIFRFMARVPLVNVDQAHMNQLLAGNLTLGIVDLLAGGQVLSNFSIVAAGVLPFILAQTVLTLAAIFIPALDRMIREEGSVGRERFERYVRLLSIPLALGFAWGLSEYLDRQIGLFPHGVRLFSPDSFLPSLTIITTMTAGSVFSGWLANRITEDGLGQGPAVMIWAGACLTLFNKVDELVSVQTDGLVTLGRMAILVIVSVAVVYVGVQLREGQRQVPVDYGYRPRGRRVFGGGSTFIPLRVNPAGVQPTLIANGLLVLVLLIGSGLKSYAAGWFGELGSGLVTLFSPTGWLYWALLFGLIVVFTTWYNDWLCQETDYAESLQRQGGFIPGVRPGLRTQEYLSSVVRRVSLPTGMIMGLMMAGLPFILVVLDRQEYFEVFVALLLCVDVVLDVARQVQARWALSHYEGFISDAD